MQKMWDRGGQQTSQNLPDDPGIASTRRLVERATRMADSHPSLWPRGLQAHNAVAISDPPNAPDIFATCLLASRTGVLHNRWAFQRRDAAVSYCTSRPNCLTPCCNVTKSEPRNLKHFSLKTSSQLEFKGRQPVIEGVERARNWIAIGRSR